MRSGIRYPLGSMASALLILFLFLLFLLPPVLAFSEENEASLALSHIAPEATDKQRTIYEDADVKMVSVSYGTADARSKPGFYVYRKAKADWIRIDKVSTKGAVLGRNPTLEEVKKANKAPPSIGWDFRHLAKQPAVAFPLTFGGFLFFPDKVEKDKAKQEYVLHFNSKWEIPGVETIFRFSIDDLLPGTR